MFRIYFLQRSTLVFFDTTYNSSVSTYVHMRACVYTYLICEKWTSKEERPHTRSAIGFGFIILKNPRIDPEMIEVTCILSSYKNYDSSTRSSHVKYMPTHNAACSVFLDLVLRGSDSLNSLQPRSHTPWFFSFFLQVSETSRAAILNLHRWH